MLVVQVSRVNVFHISFVRRAAMGKDKRDSKIQAVKVQITLAFHVVYWIAGYLQQICAENQL